MPIDSWSHSKLVEFEKCKYRAFLLHDSVGKVPEPERPLRPGQTEHANDLGTRIHEAAELFVRGTDPFLPEMKTYQAEFEALQRLCAAGKVSLEGEWGMDINWEPCEWKKAWHRVKLDALVFLSKTEAIAIDYKTGKKFGNEIKHGEQLQLYQLNTFLRYPELEIVHTELWYLDIDELTSMTYRRAQGLRFKNSWHGRGTKLTTCTEFPPNANIWSCKFCMYGPWAGPNAPCKVGVQK